MVQVVLLEQPALRALAELQPHAASPEPQVLLERPACRALRPVVFRRIQQGKRKVQPGYPQAFRPRLDVGAAFPQNRWP